MNNYIMINNHKIGLTEEQVYQIIASHNPGIPTIKLADIAEGDTFKIAEHEFIVLEQSGDTTVVIRKELLPGSRFGETNNYNGSTVDAACSKFAEDIASIVEKENIVQHTVDLTSSDGLKDYGTINRLASLLTADRYRRYVEILDNFKPNSWWWLSTPFSTKTHDNDSWVLCVAPSGSVNVGSCGSYGCGVRPFCILKSTIFVSK